MNVKGNLESVHENAEPVEKCPLSILAWLCFELGASEDL